MSERQHRKCSSCGDVRECVLVGAESDEGWVHSWQCEGCVRGMLDGFGETDTIARLTRERDEAREAACDETCSETMDILTSERDGVRRSYDATMARAEAAEAARAALVATTRREATELHRACERHKRTSAALRAERDLLRDELSDSTRALVQCVRERDEARAERAQLACEVSDLLIEVGRLTRSRALCVGALRGVQATGDVDEQTWDVVADGIAALRAEVTRLRGVVHTYMTSHDEQVAQERLALIGQSVRERDAAIRWSRLWHREARRLWREVQDLGAMLDDVQREVEPEQWMRAMEGDQ